MSIAPRNYPSLCSFPPLPRTTPSKQNPCLTFPCSYYFFELLILGLSSLYLQYPVEKTINFRC
uniref:Uncharacterized protein n=1 Tax=Nelumbo nucifera TaxID=4432 RepID=A0A822Y991_NELNU|nr:TPA_asm: hypothetical protein HUJ06_030111 [Nelumbo nucifera]